MPMKDLFDTATTLEALHVEARACTRCPLHLEATQVISARAPATRG